MKLCDIIFWAIRQIKTRLIESLLIVLGIGLGIAVVCSVLGLYNTFQQVSAEAEQLYRQFSVRSIEDAYNLERDRALTLLGEFGEQGEKLKLADYFRFKEADIEGTDYIWSIEKIRDEQHAYMATPDVFPMAKLEIISGDIFRDWELLNQSQVVVLGKKMAEKRFPDEDPIGKQLQLNAGKFTVIGVVQTQLDVEKTPYVIGIGATEDLDYHLYLPFFKDEFFELNLLAAEDVKITDYYARLKDYVSRHYKNDLSVMGNLMYYQENQKGSFATVKTIAILAIIVLLIAVINILNLMLARVFRRYKHIGISVAVGASKRDIFRLFIWEAIMLGILGSIIGILFSIGATYLMKALINQPVQLSMLNSLIGIGVAFVTSLLFGFYPASQAAKIDPVDALRVD
ncbi:MAG: ABC transporter permease [Halanaerobiales bacterium]|nr:ABC transporter permease [Halanaerobiales bacterium]